MDLTKPADLAISAKSVWPNMIIFPKELRDAIPDYGSRALVFDSVHGSHHKSPVPAAGLIDEALFNFGNRAQVEFLVHETGKLDGKFALLMDLDPATTRALGQFLIDLANKADPCNG